MKNKFLGIASLFFLGMTADAQQIKFEEYDLPNGLHVILHQDNSAPVVTTSVMYQKQQVEQDLLIFLNTFYLKELKILQEEIGSK